MSVRRIRFGRLEISLTVIVVIAITLMSACSDESGPSQSQSLPELVVWPQQIADTTPEGIVNSERIKVKVDCPPFECVPYTFEHSEPWIYLTTLSGENSGVTRDSFLVWFDVEDLPVGTYVDSIVIRSAEVSNSPQIVEVTYAVQPREPITLVDEDRIYMYASRHEEILAPDSFVVSCFDFGTYEYTIEEYSDWLTASCGDGVTPDTVVVNFDPTDVTTGEHYDTLWINSDGMTGDPLAVECILMVAPWVPQEMPDPACQLNDVVFADPTRGWAVGGNQQFGYTDGFMIETFDGGKTWEPLMFISADLGEYVGFFALELIGDHVWAVGQSGMIYHSPDLGSTWENVSTDLDDTSVVLLDIVFVNEQTGWISGQRGLILRTDDGGDTWVKQSTSSSLDFWAVEFVDELNGWAAGQSGAIVHTTDGGSTWQWLNGPNTDFRDVEFVDAANGWAVGRGCVAYTSDGGQNWTEQYGAAVAWFMACTFVDERTGWVVGNEGYLLYTDNGGISWDRRTCEFGTHYAGITFADAQYGWIVGYGTILNTSSGGNP